MNILSSSSGNRQDSLQAFLTPFPVFVEDVLRSPGIFKGLET